MDAGEAKAWFGGDDPETGRFRGLAKRKYLTRIARMKGTDYTEGKSTERTALPHFKLRVRLNGERNSDTRFRLIRAVYPC